MAFLPSSLRQSLRHRLMEAGGLLLFGLAALWAVILWTHHRGDPSWNTAGSGPTENALGPLGASLSDMALQGVGVAALVPALVLVTWGGRLLGHRPVTRAGWRLLLLVPTLLLSALALSCLPTPPRWPFLVGLGGVVGDGLQTALGHALGLDPAGALGVPVLVVAGALALAAFLGVAALGLGEWVALGRDVGRGLFAVVRGGVRGGQHVGRWVGRRPRAPAPRGRRRRAGGDSASAPSWQQDPADLPPVSDFTLPTPDLLQPPPDLRGAPLPLPDPEHTARTLEAVLRDFGVRGQIVGHQTGPVVTLFELDPAPGTKTARVVALSDDIARSMAVTTVRVAVVPGRSVIGIEVPNPERQTVALRTLAEDRAFTQAGQTLPLILGRDIAGAPVVEDLATMPHLLVAGTTGSGKSVGLHAMILSLLMRRDPDSLRLLLIDPKMLELSVYEDIPHLLTPVITDARQAVAALQWLIHAMEDRYRAMSHLGVRHLAGYNARVREARERGEVLLRRVQTGFDRDTGKPLWEEQPLGLDPLPHMVVVVDEMADLMLTAGREVETAVQRLAQMARAAGIHLIMATQRPSVDVITGTLKANFPTRLSYQVTTRVDSRTILDEPGAEQLLGRGDMLFMAGAGRVMRVHGPLVIDDEVRRVAEALRAQGQPLYVGDLLAAAEAAVVAPEPSAPPEDPAEALYREAVALVCREQRASTSFLQRRLEIGYNRAARFIERMEEEGVVGAPSRTGRREVLGSPPS